MSCIERRIAIDDGLKSRERVQGGEVQGKWRIPEDGTSGVALRQNEGGGKIKRGCHAKACLL